MKPGPMEFRDQLGDLIRLPGYPERIVSLVPSMTETLFDLGLDDEIVGVTRYCTLPAGKVAGRVKVGGTKRFDLPVIEGLRPDLIVGNREENDRDGIVALRKRYPVWIGDVASIDDALLMIRGLGEVVGRPAGAAELIDEIRARLETYPTLKVAYLIWKNPYMAAGGGTFIDAMLRKCGFLNIFGERAGYPRVGLDDLADAEVALLASEPYPFTPQEVAAIARACPAPVVRLVDGAVFSWYGSRMRFAGQYFSELRESI